jgi:hypothetical protein
MNNTRLRVLLILASASLLIAAACFFLGGLIAEATSATPIMGVTFKAGGSLAGFLISFGALFLGYQKIGGASLMLKVAVSSQAGPFTRAGNLFKAKTTVLKIATGVKIDGDADAIWEAGSLTVHLRDLEQDDLVMILITDDKGGCWQSDFFSPLCPKVMLT